MTNTVKIFDTTLRDGEQAPGFSMDGGGKLRMARALSDLGVDIIEAGFAVASPGDFEAVQTIAREITGTTICSLARCNTGDIRAAGEAIAPAKDSRVHVFIATSPLHREFKLKMSKDQVIEKAVAGITLALEYTDNVEFSCEDAIRTERDYLQTVVEHAIAAGATTINIPDTVGYTVPDEYFDLMSMLIEKVPGADEVVFSTHCHNDLGMAVANSLAGVRAGARQIECTINGLGERAGNAALEEVVMAMNVRSDVVPYWSNINCEMITRASKLVAGVTAFPVQYNKAIVGKNAFAHEAGIHQDGMLKNTQTYEIMTPESVGLKESSLVMGKHSGRHAFREKIKDLGYEIGDNAIEDAFVRFKDLADKKKHIYDEDIEALVDDEMASSNDRIKVVALQVIAGTSGPQKATLTLDVDGTQHSSEAAGDGPVDAIFNAIKDIVPHDARLPLYQVHAVTEGTDAQAEVSVRLEESGKTVTGRGADTDTMVASARAYVSALNKLWVKREKTAPGSMLAS